MKNRFHVSWLLLATIVLLGCQDSKPMAKTEAVSGTKAGSKLSEKEVLVRLQAADRLDGNEDKIVHRCYVCNLGMDGKEEHSAEHLGYTAHLCSSGCLANFKKNPEEVISETAIPAPKKQ